MVEAWEREPTVLINNSAATVFVTGKTLVGLTIRLIFQNPRSQSLEEMRMVLKEHFKCSNVSGNIFLV
jgi:hypothetical protein